MRLPFRSRQTGGPPPEPVGVPALLPELALAALAGHAAQLDERLERMEHRLDELGIVAQIALELPANGDLFEVRQQAAQASAELTRVTEDLRARIDELAAQLPAVVAEDCRQQRARTLAETIIDLSDALDTTSLDLGADGSGEATARTPAPSAG